MADRYHGQPTTCEFGIRLLLDDFEEHNKPSAG